MTLAASERYRGHQVWSLLELKLGELTKARYDDPEREAARLEVVAVLQLAHRAKARPKPTVYDDVLDGLQEYLNSLNVDEQEFQHFLNYIFSPMLGLVRQLPTPKQGEISKEYLDALDSAIELRKKALARLQHQAEEIGVNLLEAKAELVGLRTEIKAQTRQIAADSATIAQVASTAEEQLEAEWKNRLEAWTNDRTAKDQDFDRDLATNIRLLAGSASIGQRLLEYAAGRVTAKDWASRATRERRNATSLRLGSIVMFVLAVLTGTYILSVVAQDGFQLTVGDGILRGALVLALLGVGSFFTFESRRHFTEADSAEEVSLALTAIEPFYENADTTERAQARSSLGDAVFVKNVLSRFASRDATKHANTTSQELSEVADILTKGASIGKSVSPGA